MRRTGLCHLYTGALAAGIVLAVAVAVTGAAGAEQGHAGARNKSHEGGPQLVTPGTGGRSLSRELSRTGGVIHPPPIGRASTPVIPPPGTPGGNPDVKPK